jgi:HEAT repeat protein
MRRVLLVLVMVGTCAPAARPSGAAPEPAASICATVDRCIARARQLVHRGGGISDAQQRLANRLHELGPAAVEPVLALLDDRDEGMRDFAGYALRRMPGLDARHLSRLAQAMEEDPGWLPLAVARIGTPEAIRLLIDTLARLGSGQRDQVVFALQEVGPRAFPDLLSFFSCASSCNESLLRGVADILGGQRARAADAVAPLAAIAGDPGAPLVARRLALVTLGQLRATSEPAASDLLSIARAGPPELRADARAALLRIGGPVAADVLIEALRSPDLRAGDETADFARTLVLRDIAELGARGAAAGAAVASYLDDANTDVRVAAARTLGFIGARESVPALMRCLEQDDDVRLPLVAAESLGRLRAESAIDALDRVARAHWYPPVRLAAATASRAAGGGPGYARKYHENNFALDYFEFENVTAGKPCATRPRAAGNGTEKRFDAALAESLAYDRAVQAFGPNGERLPRHRRIVPRVGLRVASGWLVGADDGEFGGELVFKGDDGTSRTVLDANVKSIHLMPDGRMVVPTGLAHLMSNKGALYVVACDASSCRATLWKRLPGAPRDSWLTESGELHLNTEGGSIVVAPDGSMRMADCWQPAVSRKP